MKSSSMDDEDENVVMAELFDNQCNAIDIELIDLVKERKALYDIRVPHSDRTREAKEALWNEICQSMQTGKLKPHAAEIRWKYLRENYIKARKKQKVKEEWAKKTGVPLKTNKYNRKYPYRYHEQMLFLDDALDYQKQVTIKNTSNVNKRSKKKSEQLNARQAISKVKKENMSNDGNELLMPTDALFDHQYEAVAIPVAIQNNEVNLSLNSSTVEVRSSSSLDSTTENNDGSNINYEQLFLNYLKKSTEKLSPIDGFLARLGEGLKRLPYRERSKLELEFLSRLNEVEDELGLLN